MFVVGLGPGVGEDEGRGVVAAVREGVGEASSAPPPHAVISARVMAKTAATGRILRAEAMRIVEAPSGGGASTRSGSAGRRRARGGLSAYRASTSRVVASGGGVTWRRRR